MLGDTFVLPHADGDITCVKINQDAFGSVYRYVSTTQRVVVTVKHTTTKAGKDRHNIEVQQTIFATAEAAEIYRKHYLVLENDPSDLDVKLLDATCDWLIATAGANITKLINWQS